MSRLKSLMSQFKAQMGKLEAQIDPFKAIQKKIKYFEKLFLTLCSI